MSTLVIIRKHFNTFAAFRMATYPKKSSMEKFQKESCIRGYHVYKELCDAVNGEELECQWERGNAADIYAVAVIKDSSIVGHLPRKISRICALFIRRGVVIYCRVTGRREYSTDLPQGGVEIPCLLLFEGETKEIKKLVKLISRK